MFVSVDFVLFVFVFLLIACCVYVFIVFFFRGEDGIYFVFHVCFCLIDCCLFLCVFCVRTLFVRCLWFVICCSFA